MFTDTHKRQTRSAFAQILCTDLEDTRVPRIPPPQNVNIRYRIHRYRCSVRKDRLRRTDLVRVEHELDAVRPHVVPDAHKHLDQNLSYDVRKEDESRRNHLQHGTVFLPVVQGIRLGSQGVDGAEFVARGEKRTDGRSRALELEIEMPRIFDLLVPHTDASHALKKIGVVLERPHPAPQAVLEWRIEVEQRANHAAFHAVDSLEHRRLQRNRQINPWIIKPIKEIS